MWRVNRYFLSPQWNHLSRCSKRTILNRNLCAVKEKYDSLGSAGQFKPGDRIHGYTVNKVLSVPELFLVSVQLTHDKTGAQHLHIARDDSNNVFSVGFRTTPMDSTGVSHILEHTVLCGSQSYPVRDPFFKMLNRSLSTFMNAFTASDFTMYPFSTQNAKDFENLLSVYLDAAFFPHLREQDFRQEGWRLEPEDLSDPNSPIIFKGVVFNEMKGAMSTPESLFSYHAQRNLLPSHTYSNNSGGDPLCIPDLTWQQLKDFHASHYHPSNSRFYTYGDLPLESHLKSIENKVLRHFDKISITTDIPHEPRWTESREKHVTCPFDPMAANPEKQTAVGLHYLTGSTTDSFEALTMVIISSLLTSGPNSPFYQSLIAPNIGSGYCAGVGYDNSTKDASYTIGLQGIKKEDYPRVVETIHNTFDKVIEEGFPSERIEAALHSIELATKHQSSNFGLGLIMGIMSMWNHDADPADFLPINDRVEMFKKKLEHGSFLQDKLKECFKDNPHCLTLVMSPDPEYERDLNRKEQEKLHGKVSILSEEDKTMIYTKGIQLAEQQNASEDLSCLPRMTIEDIDPLIKPVTLEHYISAGVPVQYCEQPTNGISYFRAISSITDIPEELREYLPLFCYILTKMGAGHMNYMELDQLIKLRTGGMGLSTHITTHHSDLNGFEQGLEFSSHCLDRNLPHMFYLWSEIFARPTLNNPDLLRTLVNLLASDLAMSVSHSGHMYAMMLASSSLCPASGLVEQFGGLSQVLFMKNLAEMEDLTSVIEKFSTIAVQVLEGTQFRCAVNTTAEGRKAVETALEGFCDSLPSSLYEESSHVKNPDFKPTAAKTHFEVPFPVNYISRCLPTVPYTHEDFPKLRILAKMLSANFLHREIREKGGAYGSGAKIGGGIFSFYSYRDPNFEETLSAFEHSVQWAAEGKFTEQDIEEAKISVLAQIDRPVSPSNRGMLYFTQGVTDDMRQKQKDQLFGVTREDLIHVARTYLASSDIPNSIAVLGPGNKITARDSSWTIRRESLT
ncbi:presequence protease, mitochondrial-like [Porites lutea]|uniref:presequence protease, mitochondrial-like n=1 Tax=Porites lutea TaxID=51062 RepID=UPI003CC5AB58